LRTVVLAGLLIVLQSLTTASGQTVARPSLPEGTPEKTRDTLRACQALRTCITNPAFATGMKCDGVTDDSRALQTALNSAAGAGLGNAAVIMPPGTCLIDPGAHVSINSSLWLYGSGRFGTTLKRRDSSAGGFILLIRANAVTLSDFGIDGNKDGPNITDPADSVGATTPISDLSIQRMRFVNATNSDISSHLGSASDVTVNWSITDSQFLNEGNLSCMIALTCANILIDRPLQLYVLRNRADESQTFALFNSGPGVGQVDVSDNMLTGVNGFGVALGGGPIGAAGAIVRHNLISTTTVNPYNLIDLALWSDFVVGSNVLYHNGTSTTANAPNGCIADGPPASHGVIDANVCFVSPAPAINTAGIAVGGSDTSITNNYVEGANSNGIGFTVSTAASGVRITGNTTKNNGQNPLGPHAGIELYINPTFGTAAISDVIIQGNHSYDDQPHKTQAYGIGIAINGQNTALSNVIIEGNDVSGNAIGGVLNNCPSLNGLVIRNNLGYNPVGVITAPAFPDGRGTTVANTTGFDVEVYITSGMSPIKIAINGITLNGVAVPGGNVVGPPIPLAANQSITLTYTSGGTPSWQWVAN
jgi:Pectate lyase superfamily protein